MTTRSCPSDRGAAARVEMAGIGTHARRSLRHPRFPTSGNTRAGKYDDNYRHRMMVNLAALGFTAVLAVAGIWLVIQLADLRKNQDCVLSGRRNCAPIDVKALER